MEHQDSFSIVGCIESIINVFNDNMEYIAIFELLLIIFLLIFYISKKQELEDKCDQLQKDAKYYYENSKILQKKISEYDQKIYFLSGNNKNPESVTVHSNPLPEESLTQRTSLNNTNESVNVDFKKEDKQERVPDLEPIKEPKESRSYMYMEPATNGRFFRLKASEERCYFRTWLDNGVRKFEFCGNSTNALANFNATFDDSCEYEGKQSGASEIVNIEPGTLDDKLTIITKAKIRLL